MKFKSDMDTRISKIQQQTNLHKKKKSKPIMIVYLYQLSWSPHCNTFIETALYDILDSQ